MNEISNMENKTSLTNMTETGKKKILVVDDNEMVCLLVKSILNKDYEIITKSDGEDALEYLKQKNRPDLILLDMIMPKMNGRVFVRRVHADPRFSKVPIMFITSVDSTMLINSFKAMGVIDFIIKPFENNDLLEKVNDFFKSK